MIHQLKFSSKRDAYRSCGSCLKRIWWEDSLKKKIKGILNKLTNIENFTAPISEMLDQTFDRLQKLVSQLKLLGEKISQEDVNEKLLRSLSPKRNTHAVVWRNKTNLDTMSMDDLYNNLKVYEPEVKGMSSSSSSTQNMAFVSSSNNNTSSTNEAVNTAHEVSTASTQVNSANFTNIDKLSDDEGSLLLMAMRILVLIKSKVECYNCHKRGHIFARSKEAPEIKTTRTRKAQEGVCMWNITSIALVSCDGLGG
ncbi:hypothetical protein Tco_1217396 [Tanacetum coccineum]